MCTRIAMGAALDLNPLVVLGATIGAGCIFGTMGLILAAPLLSAAVHITKRLGHARAAAGLEPAQLANEARSQSANRPEPARSGSPGFDHAGCSSTVPTS
jgi:hypothetical protein